MVSVTLNANPQGLVAWLTCAASKDSGSNLPPSKNSPLDASAQNEVVSVSSGVSKVKPEPIGVSASSESYQKICPPLVSASNTAVVPSQASTEVCVTVKDGASQSELITTV